MHHDGPYSEQGWEMQVRIELWEMQVRTELWEMQIRTEVWPRDVWVGLGDTHQARCRAGEVQKATPGLTLPGSRQRNLLHCLTN